MPWSDIKRELVERDRKECLRVIKCLYDLNRTNKTFLEAALGDDKAASISAYKKEISEAIDPKVEDPIELRRGRKAISDYKRANPSGTWGAVDLMLHYLEAGANQTLAYGDIDEAFYDSMCTMVDKVIEVGSSLKDSDHSKFVIRFAALNERTKGKVGWGYSDHIEAAASELNLHGTN